MGITFILAPHNPVVAEKFWSAVTGPEVVVGDRGVDKVGGPSE